MTHGNCRFYFSILRPKPPTKQNFTLFLIHRLRLCYHLPTQKCVFIILIGFVVSAIKRLCSRKQHTRLPYNIFSRKNSFIVCHLDKYEQIVCVCTVLRIKQKKNNKMILQQHAADESKRRFFQTCSCMWLLTFDSFSTRPNCMCGRVCRSLCHKCQMQTQAHKLKQFLFVRQPYFFLLLSSVFFPFIFKWNNEQNTI